MMAGSFENSWIDLKLWLGRRFARINHTAASGDDPAFTLKVVDRLTRPDELDREVERFETRLKEESVY
jgi:hypothetical protein